MIAESGKSHVDIARVREILDRVVDPEIPVITIADLGILRDVRVEDDRVTVVITPTYSGCPAMDMITNEIRTILAGHGIDQVAIETRIRPAWTTDWLSEAGRRKLREYGIAPPAEPCSDKRMLRAGTAPVIACPLCGSEETERVSEFGSTACKALYRCRDCLEPFDYFKCL